MNQHPVKASFALHEMNKSGLALTAIGSLTMIIGILFWISVTINHLNIVYVSNLKSEISITELGFMDNLPILQIVFILSGATTVVLSRLKRVSTLPFGIISLALVATLLLDFPLQWFWTTIGTCLYCSGYPFFIMVYPFLVDWTLWCVMMAGLFIFLRRDNKRYSTDSGRNILL